MTKHTDHITVSHAELELLNAQVEDAREKLILILQEDAKTVSQVDVVYAQIKSLSLVESYIETVLTEHWPQSIQRDVKTVELFDIVYSALLKSEVSKTRLRQLALDKIAADHRILSWRLSETVTLPSWVIQTLVIHGILVV